MQVKFRLGLNLAGFHVVEFVVAVNGSARFFVVGRSCLFVGLMLVIRMMVAVMVAGFMARFSFFVSVSWHDDDDDDITICRHLNFKRFSFVVTKATPRSAKKNNKKLCESVRDLFAISNAYINSCPRSFLRDNRQ